MNENLVEHYRCAESLIALQSPGSLERTPGYFRFGPDAICYGQCSAGVSRKFAKNGLPDALEHSITNGLGVRLPFDPDQVCNNLRLERYLATSGNNQGPMDPWPLARDLYYFLRPAIPAGLRKHLQILYLRSWDKIAFPNWPVDTTVEKLFGRLLALSMKALKIDQVPFIWFWPEEFLSCAILTHDVETSRGRDFCQQLMDLDDSFGIKASFQIVPEGRYKVPDHFLDSIRQRQFELNIQDLNHDGQLFRSRKQFIQRMERINQYAKAYGAKGFRSAVLYRNVDWYDQVHFPYDMSIPNVAHLEAQKGGCCTVFPYFIGDVLELPVTTTQDYALFTFLKDYSIELWKAQIKTIMENYGLISLIVHPDYIQDRKPQEIYRMLLAQLCDLRSRGHLWIVQPGEVNRWWRERSQMRLVESNGSWTILGPGSARARVARAVLDGDSVRYMFDARGPHSRK